MRCLVVPLLLGLAAVGHAHDPTTSALELEVVDREIRGQWHVPLEDLDYALGLDGNHDGAITWGEVKARHPVIAAFMLPHLVLESGSRPCRPELGEQLYDKLDGKGYGVLRFTARCPEPVRDLRVENAFFFDLDPEHRGVLTVRWGEERRSSVLSPGASRMRVDLTQGGSTGQVLDYLLRGWDAALTPLFLLLAALLLLPLKERFLVAAVFLPGLLLACTAVGLERVPAPELGPPYLAAVLLVAAVAALRPERVLRVGAALLGGLAAGVWFGAALLAQGLPPDAQVLSLLAFELGVVLVTVPFGLYALLTGSASRPGQP